MTSDTPEGGMTPLHIEIALHYCKSQDSEVAAYIGRDSDATAQIHREFADAGLLEIAGDNKHWKATERMHLYVEALCRVPLPINQPGMPPDRISQPEAIQKEKNKNIGDETINTRNQKIASVMDEYLATTPQAKL